MFYVVKFANQWRSNLHYTLTDLDLVISTSKQLKCTVVGNSGTRVITSSSVYSGPRGCFARLNHIGRMGALSALLKD